MILGFSVELHWFPSSGYVPLTENFVEGLKRLALPSLALAVPAASVIARHTRSAVANEMGSDYIRTARAKGISTRRAVVVHALRNAGIPIVTIGMLEFGSLLSGAVITEQIFGIPGFGRLIVDSVYGRDYFVIQGVIVAAAIIYMVVNLCADIAYVILDPTSRG